MASRVFQKKMCPLYNSDETDEQRGGRDEGARAEKKAQRARRRAREWHSGGEGRRDSPQQHRRQTVKGARDTDGARARHDQGETERDRQPRNMYTVGEGEHTPPRGF